MENLDKFNRIAITVFSRCYSVFPIECSFSYDEFFDNKNSKDEEIFYTSFFLLERYGYIIKTNNTIGTGLIDGVLLTEKALHILNCTPSSLKEQCSIGEKVSLAAKEGTKIAFTEAAKLVMQYGVAFFSHM